MDVKNNDTLFSTNRVKKWLPVDMYIGGAEHSVLHLLYTRFITKVFHDWGLVEFDEPFRRFRAHGLIIKEGTKMSKSKGNIVNPDEYIDKFGADALRTYLMFLAPFERGGDFKDSDTLGIIRFLDRVWRLCTENFEQGGDGLKIERVLHQSIKKVTEDIKSLKYNTAISQLMVLSNEMEKNATVVSTNEWGVFLKLLAPFAPHITEELWHQLGNSSSIHTESWPEYKQALIEEDMFELVVQINGKVRDVISVKKDITKEEAEHVARDSEKVQAFLQDTDVKQVIFVEGRLINFVT